MTIYIDDDYKCYVSAADGRRAIETNEFDGKCKVFIEGYRFVPAGEKWVMPNGVFFKGEMVAPWRDYSYLQVVQAAYEEGQDEILTTVESALGVGM